MPRVRDGSEDRNHGHNRRAIGRAAGHAVAAMAALFLLGFAPAAMAQDNPLVQRDVPAEATAENAVVARDRALASGQRIAYQRMAAALGLPANASDSQIDGMVASLVIESERVTPRGYAARITVNFRAAGGGRGPVVAPEGAPPASAGGGGATTIQALASYRSLGEYAALARGLANAQSVARVEVLSLSGDRAQMRLRLRQDAGEAASELAQAGVLLLPVDSGTEPREWRLSVGSR